ncbi:hypothetical protein D3C84_1035930 [compost metagenome]
MNDLGLRRQFCRDLFLGPAQQKRLDPAVEVLKSDFAGALFNRHAVIAVEAFHIAKPAGQQEVK